MIPANFDYESPRTLSEALALLASREEARILAGGHSLLPAMKLRIAQPPLLVDLGRIPGLSYIRDAREGIAIGTMTTHAVIAESELVREHCPLLAAAAASIGDVQVRNRGTIGGSLAHSDPAADYPASILALDAELVAMSEKGERAISARDYFTGLFSTALRQGEILTEIRVPATRGSGTSYKKFRHPASGFAVVGVAAVVTRKNGKIDHASVGITGVAENAYRAKAVERALENQPSSAIAWAAAHAADKVEALSDTFASGEYRRHIAEVYTRRALEEAYAAAGEK